MASIMIRPKLPPTKIDRFLGINLNDTGDTQLQVGESPNMLNFRITSDYKLRTREGYIELFPKLNKPIKAAWRGKIGNDYHFLFACDGKVYKYGEELTVIGNIQDAMTNFINFNDKLYIQDGHEYYSWDGATFKTVEGYVPTVAIGTPPAGGGTPYEQINLLTDKKKQLFSGDGTSKDYQLLETNITSVDKVYVNGDLQTPGTHYSVNLVTGKVTFTTAPSDAAPDNVEIEWTKVTAGNRSQVTACRAAMTFGGANDTRIHIWGNPQLKNRRLTSGIPINQSTSAEYFPVNMNADIGSYEYAITDIIRQYDRMVILKERSSYYSYYEVVDGTGSFPVYPLNGDIGNVAFNQAQLVQNNPYSVFTGVYEWVATSVRDERNAQFISERVQSELEDIDLTQAITVDYEDLKEYWLAIDRVVYIYNYRNNTWYKFELAHKPTCFIVIDKDLHFGTEDGYIMRFGEDSIGNILTTDDGEPIHKVWEMHFYDFQAEHLRKYLNRIWVSIQPGAKEEIDLSWQTNRDSSRRKYRVEYKLMDYSNVDYGDWSYLTYYNPQPERLKIKAKKFVYFKLILENTSITATATVLSINLQTRMGGESK